MKSHRSQSGVALVITLIMLSVITLIAVAFLALSQRERASISQTLTGTDTEWMANTGLERAKGHIMAQVTAFLSTNLYTNAYNEVAPSRVVLGPGLTVSVASTNYPYPTPPQYPPNFQNADLQALTNLLLDPSPPVFSTNRTGASEHVSFLDLNRNGKFERTGFVPLIDRTGNRIGDHAAVGDPQWIGVLQRINERHSSSNRFIGRYAFLIQPVGCTLDIDHIHNRTKPTPGTQDGFYRTEGHATWEINMAAFLSDLNTNYWPRYNYNLNRSSPSSGIGFEDAVEILRYRYNNAQPRNARDMFGYLADAFAADGVDQYVDGSNNNGYDNDAPSAPWVGAVNPQHFFTIHDFFNAKTPSIGNFQNRLANAGRTQVNSYDVHTFYRMLAQLGTDTAPEKASYRVNAQGRPLDDARINLNYANTNGVSPTDFEAWTPEVFFQVAADRILRDNRIPDHTFSQGNYLSVTNLLVYPTNLYSPAVHRILQMTLNIYDATRNDLTRGHPGFPIVLQPRFEVRGSSILITGYHRFTHTEVLNPSRWRDLNEPNDRSALQSEDFVYGVPVLVGAKKGFPNFNELVLQSTMQFERKLQVEKTGPRTARTNHMFMIGVSNFVALEAWNSYSNRYPRALTMYVGLTNTTTITNDERFARSAPFGMITALPINANDWQGGQFRIPVFSNYTVLPYSIYRSGNPGTLHPTNPPLWELSRFPAPQWVVSTTNRLRFFLFDGPNLVDAVGLAPAVLSLNATKALHDMDQVQNTPGPFGVQGPVFPVWRTNRVGGAAFNRTEIPTEGIREQLRISQVGRGAWDNFGTWPTVQNAAAGFRDFVTRVLSDTNITATNMMAPFTPQHKVYQRIVWQANDPLVHHMVEDLRFTNSAPPRYAGVYQFALSGLNIADTNQAYRPWGGSASQDQEDPGRGTQAHDGATKDPLVRSSNDWDFPTNKFGSVGWLGNVHRGTPWQTIYLKSPVAPMQTWTNVHQSTRSHPTNDWRLADLFTVALHPNGSRGRLAVNQTNVAAWSAVLSGLEVPTIFDNPSGPVVQNIVIKPAVVEPYVDQLVEAINRWREALPGQVFANLSEFLAVPELTVRSPYLSAPYVPGNLSDPSYRQVLLSDSDYEAIPQKILSLIKPGEARFVVYAFGQALKPAPQSVIPGGPFRGLCVNYEVTGELAVRAVMRVDVAPGPRLNVVTESFNILPPD